MSSLFVEIFCTELSTIMNFLMKNCLHQGHLRNLSKMQEPGAHILDPLHIGGGGGQICSCLPGILENRIKYILYFVSYSRRVYPVSHIGAKFFDRREQSSETWYLALCQAWFLLTSDKEGGSLIQKCTLRR